MSKINPGDFITIRMPGSNRGQMCTRLWPSPWYEKSPTGHVYDGEEVLCLATIKGPLEPAFLTCVLGMSWVLLLTSRGAFGWIPRGEFTIESIIGTS